jgi:hypothetical protein
MESLVQVCLPKSVGQNGIIYYVPAKCEQITCTVGLPKGVFSK